MILLMLFLFPSTVNALSSLSTRRLTSASFSLLKANYIDLLERPVITSESNDKLKKLNSLKAKKNRDKLNLVLLEGHRQVIDAITNGLVPDAVIMTDAALLAPLGQELAESLQSLRRTSAVFSFDYATKSLIDKISDTVNSQGVIASFKKPPQVTLQDVFSYHTYANVNVSTNKLLLALDGVSDPGSLGTLVRSGFGLGVDTVLSFGGCDAWSPKVLRSSMGTCLRHKEMPIVESRWEDVFALQEEGGLAEFQILLAVSSKDSVNYDSIDFSKPTLVVIGSEATGISEQALSGLRRAPRGRGGEVINITIPMSRALESFNAAMAGTSILAEAARQRRKSSLC
jgi:TrmH family RNA methyltransferase